MSVIKKIRRILVLPVLIITLIAAPAAKSAPGAELISSDLFVLEEAMATGQGIATDGKYFYTSGAITALNLTALGKLSIENPEFEKIRFNPLPGELAKLGYNHIGGVSVYKNKIYAPVEGNPDGKYISCITVFNCDDLKPTGEIYELPGEDYYHGVPWCAVNPETGLLYASTASRSKILYEYDVENGMELVREIPLKGLGELDRIQGGDFYNGKLYLSQDTKNDGGFKRILFLDVGDGEISVAARRDAGREERVEAEGATFYPAADGSVMHVLDYDKLAGVFLRHYAVDFLEPQSRRETQ